MNDRNCRMVPTTLKNLCGYWIEAGRLRIILWCESVNISIGGRYFRWPGFDLAVCEGRHLRITIFPKTNIANPCILKQNIDIM